MDSEYDDSDEPLETPFAGDAWIMRQAGEASRAYERDAARRIWSWLGRRDAPPARLADLHERVPELGVKLAVARVFGVSGFDFADFIKRFAKTPLGEAYAEARDHADLMAGDRRDAAPFGIVFEWLRASKHMVLHDSGLESAAAARCMLARFADGRELVIEPLRQLVARRAATGLSAPGDRDY